MNFLRFFPSRRIAWYMAKLFLTRSFAILAMLVLVLQTLDLLTESAKILATPGNGDAEIWRYVTLRTPQIVATFLPFSVLLGTLLTLVTLNQNSEVTAMKAGGMSAHQILAPLFLAALFVAGLSFAFNDRVVAPASGTLTAWERVEFRDLPRDTSVRSNLWVRSGDTLIAADFTEGVGANFRASGVSLYQREGDRVSSILTARSARMVAPGRWEFTDARRFDPVSGRVDTLGTVTMPFDMTPERLTLEAVDGEALGAADLKRAIAALDAAGRPTQELKTALQAKFAGPLSAILMPLLGAIAGMGLARSGKTLVRAAIGMALGFGYFVASNFGIAMGNLGAYPPWLAAWGPFLLFAMIGELVLLRSEE